MPMRLSEPCVVPGCTHIAWRACEGCHRPFCQRHGTWRRETVEEDQLSGFALYSFAFLCADCQAYSHEEHECSSAQAGVGPGMGVN